MSREEVQSLLEGSAPTTKGLTRGTTPPLVRDVTAPRAEPL
jgi:hypothetical protein